MELGPPRAEKWGRAKELELELRTPRNVAFTTSSFDTDTQDLAAMGLDAGAGAAIKIADLYA